MKRTPEDDAFIREFAPHLERVYEKAKREGVTDEDFAKSIGVERAQIKKYLLGRAMPSVRTVALAKRNHRISVSYQEVSLDDIAEMKSKKARSSKPLQLRLPFSVQVSSGESFNVEVKPSHKKTEFELRIEIERAV